MKNKGYITRAKFEARSVQVTEPGTKSKRTTGAGNK